MTIANVAFVIFMLFVFWASLGLLLHVMIMVTLEDRFNSKWFERISTFIGGPIIWGIIYTAHRDVEQGMRRNAILRQRNDGCALPRKRKTCGKNKITCELWEANDGLPGCLWDSGSKCSYSERG